MQQCPPDGHLVLATRSAFRRGLTLRYYGSWRLPERRSRAATYVRIRARRWPGEHMIPATIQDVADQRARRPLLVSFRNMNTEDRMIIRSTRPRHRMLGTTIWTVCIILAATGVAWGGYAWITRDHAPSCSWPLRMRGTATGQQAGLVRCYLQALARRDIAGVYAVADNIPKAHITAADLKYSADARTGLATAHFAPSSISTSYVGLTITYADGTIESTGILNMDAMGGPSTWRMTIGTAVNTGRQRAGQLTLVFHGDLWVVRGR
jgi:hypothetical protein